MNAKLEKWLAYTGGTRLLYRGLKPLHNNGLSGLLQLPPSPPNIDKGLTVADCQPFILRVFWLSLTL